MCFVLRLRWEINLHCWDFVTDNQFSMFCTTKQNIPIANILAIIITKLRYGFCQYKMHHNNCMTLYLRLEYTVWQLFTPQGSNNSDQQKRVNYCYSCCEHSHGSKCCWVTVNTVELRVWLRVQLKYSRQKTKLSMSAQQCMCQTNYCRWGYFHW